MGTERSAILCSDRVKRTDHSTWGHKNRFNSVQGVDSCNGCTHTERRTLQNDSTGVIKNDASLLEVHISIRDPIGLFRPPKQVGACGKTHAVLRTRLLLLHWLLLPLLPLLLLLPLLP